VGRAWAVFGGASFGLCGLVLYYGRLAFLENPVMLAMTLGTLTLASDRRVNLRWGVFAGICYAVAIGTKPNAAFGVVGLLATLGLALGRHDGAIRRWILGAAAVVVGAGLLWAAVIWLPNRDAVATDISTWPAFGPQLWPSALVDTVAAYLTDGNDHLFGELLGPLTVLAATGSVAAVALRRRLGRAETRMVVAAAAWAAFTFGILLIVTYRPNRYVVPIVPALAIVATIGLSAAGRWLADRLGRAGAAPTELATPPVQASVGGRLRESPRRSRRPASRVASRAIPALIAVVTLCATLPGLNLYRGWMSRATYDLVAIQNQFADVTPPGVRVAGPLSALFLMRSRDVTTVTAFINQGDLYSQGMRYYLQDVVSPAPTGVPAAAWAARRTLSCAAWAGGMQCLFEVP
jgi:hypothetical protein